MKIVIADGLHEADYLIHLFNSKNNDLVIINEDEDNCRYLSINNDIPVVKGRCTRKSDLVEAGAENCDLFIALSDDDYKNYVACKTAKALINAKRCVATVVNPKNVSIFKQLGIDTVVCATYLLGEYIHNFTSIENMINMMSLENEKIIIAEIRINKDLDVEGKTLQQISISDLGTVSSVIRNGKTIIPNGQTQIKENDKVLIVTTLENKSKIADIFQRKKR